METLFNMTNNNELWTIPIKRILTDSFDEEMFVNSMAHELLMTYKNEILKITFKIIEKEIFKRRKINLHKQILIKNQIYNNLAENITNIVYNMAKEYYDNNMKESYINNDNLLTQQDIVDDLDDFDTMIGDEGMVLAFSI